MRTLQFAIVFAVTLSLAFSSTPQVFAGNGCSDPHPSSASDVGTPQDPRFVCNGGGADTWFIPDDAQLGDPVPGDSNGRVPIEYDPEVGPWVKHLQIDGFDIFIGIVIPGYTDELREFLIVAPGSPAWTDWHEVIMNQPAGEEWIFTTVSITTSPPSTVIIQSIPNTNEVWVDFEPPLQPGTTIDIIKTLEYVGPITSITQSFIEVHQYPTVQIIENGGPVGGEFLPLETTSLILAGAQTFSWMIPVVLSIVGIGLFVVSRKFENS